MTHQAVDPDQVRKSEDLHLPTIALLKTLYLAKPLGVDWDGPLEAG